MFGKECQRCNEILLQRQIVGQSSKHYSILNNNYQTSEQGLVAETLLLETQDLGWVLQNRSIANGCTNLRHVQAKPGIPTSKGQDDRFEKVD